MHKQLQQAGEARARGWGGGRGQGQVQGWHTEGDQDKLLFQVVLCVFLGDMGQRTLTRELATAWELQVSILLALGGPVTARRMLLCHPRQQRWQALARARLLLNHYELLTSIRCTRPC